MGPAAAVVVGLVARHDFTMFAAFDWLCWSPARRAVVATTRAAGLHRKEHICVYVATLEAFKGCRCWSISKHRVNKDIRFQGPG